LALLDFVQQVVAAVTGCGIAESTRVSHPREEISKACRGGVDDSIAAGWRPLGPDIGPVTVHHWRRRVFDYMIAVYGRIRFTPEISHTSLAKAGDRTFSLQVGY
jgi:hypothetical protein